MNISRRKVTPTTVKCGVRKVTPTTVKCGVTSPLMEMNLMIRENKRKLKNCVIWGSINVCLFVIVLYDLVYLSPNYITFILYIEFTLLVVFFLNILHYCISFVCISLNSSYIKQRNILNPSNFGVNSSREMDMTFQSTPNLLVSTPISSYRWTPNTSALNTTLNEFLTFSIKANEDLNFYKWIHATTLMFLNLYKEFRNQVGTLKMKNLKRMFEEISKQLTHKTGSNISPTNCENMWRVLERAYKKFINNYNNRTGRASKDFEYANIMYEILGKKRNIFPNLLLFSDTVDNINDIKNNNENLPEASKQLTDNGRQQEENIHKRTVQETTKKTYKNKKLKADILQEIRQDRKQYYANRLQLEERQFQEKINKNKLIEDHNKLLKAYIEKAVHFDIELPL